MPRSSAKRTASRSHASRSTTYPGERVAITDASPSAPRSRDTYSCTMCRALTGAASPQTESISVSTDTASPMCRRRVPSSARSRRLGRSMCRPSTSASSRPSIRNVTCVTHKPGSHSREPASSAQLSGDGAPVERLGPTVTADAFVLSHRRHGTRCGRAGRRRRDTQRRRDSADRILPWRLRASAPARCSSTIRMTWAREPTRSRSRATSEPRPLDVSPASPLFPSQPSSDALNSRWISSQRRLASLYARLWVRIYDTIDAARTPAQQATLPERLKELVHAPDPLKLAAGRLELELHVPDCTGGG